MIYKNDIKVIEIKLKIEDRLTCHLVLSNDKTFTGKTKILDPSIMHNKSKLENLSLLTITKTLKDLEKKLNGI